MRDVDFRSDEEFFGADTRSPFVLLMTNFASSATSAGAVSDGLTAMQRSVSNSACSRFTPSGVSAKQVLPPAR